jgi:hypothetical protein
MRLIGRSRWLCDKPAALGPTPPWVPSYRKAGTTSHPRYPWAATDLPARPRGPREEGGELPWSTTHRRGAAGLKSPLGPTLRLKVSRHLRVRLPAVVRCNRRSRGAPKPRNELPPFHSITSSASASRFDGMVMPSALAVLRLITSSNLVGACTGKSAGLSPRKIRST